VEAASRARDVARPDLLVVAALLHDLGKALPGDHSEVGATIAATVGARMGFEPDDVRVLVDLVSLHLYLPEIATRRDLDDPATADAAAARIGDATTLDLLAALTESDARAASAQAWSTWRAALVRRLVEQCRARLHSDATEPAATSLGLRVTWSRSVSTRSASASSRPTTAATCGSTATTASAGCVTSPAPWRGPA
jgi:[protein-PII] uridylyltransferase